MSKELRAADIAAGVSRTTANAESRTCYRDWDEEATYCGRVGSEWPVAARLGDVTCAECLHEAQVREDELWGRPVSCQACAVHGDHARCTGETTLGTRRCACQSVGHVRRGAR